MITFKKVGSYYRVIFNGLYVGRVQRFEDWVVGGTRIRWEAKGRGVNYYTAQTRKEAAEFLCHHPQNS